jgi:hypothetical protein
VLDLGRLGEEIKHVFPCADADFWFEMCCHKVNLP